MLSFMYSEQIIANTKKLVEYLSNTNMSIAFAESCTGGLLSACLTEISGASKVFERSFITYSNKAKHEMLDVDEKILAEYGAVSSQIAKEMAINTIKKAATHFSISTTGIAGPDGGTSLKPVGLVYIGFANSSGHISFTENFFEGSRHQIRLKTVDKAISMILNHLSIN